MIDPQDIERGPLDPAHSLSWDDPAVKSAAKELDRQEASQETSEPLDELAEILRDLPESETPAIEGNLMTGATWVSFSIRLDELLKGTERIVKFGPLSLDLWVSVKDYRGDGDEPEDSKQVDIEEDQ